MKHLSEEAERDVQRQTRIRIIKPGSIIIHELVVFTCGIVALGVITWIAYDFGRITERTAFLKKYQWKSDAHVKQVLEPIKK